MRDDGIRRWLDGVVRAVLNAVSHVRLRRRPHRPTMRRVLITAPHASTQHPGEDDPFSGDIARSVADKLRRRGHPVHCVCSTKTRVEADQNRLIGLRDANDMLPALEKWRQRQQADDEQQTGRLDDCLHLDMHSFTRNATVLPDNWGRSFNLISLHGDGVSHDLATRMAHRLCPGGCRVVPMTRRPTTLDDADSNAMLEWGAAHGSPAGVLVEVPTELRHDGTYALDRSVDEIADRVTEAVVTEAMLGGKRPT